MKKVYIAHPFKGDIKKNIEKAKLIASTIATEEIMPIVPHLAFQYLDESTQREQALNYGLALIDICDELWICSTHWSDGMKQEIEYAVRNEIRVVNRGCMVL